MKRLILFAAISLTLACAMPAPNLTPAATLAFKGTQAVHALDALRDTAVNANAQTPPLLSTAVTRKVVLYHESTVKIIHIAPNGWTDIAKTGLDELVKDLAPPDKALLAPYVTLVQSVIAEATR